MIFILIKLKISILKVHQNVNKLLELLETYRIEVGINFAYQYMLLRFADLRNSFSEINYLRDQNTF